MTSLWNIQLAFHIIFMNILSTSLWDRPLGFLLCVLVSWKILLCPSSFFLPFFYHTQNVQVIYSRRWASIMYYHSYRIGFDLPARQSARKGETDCIDKDWQLYECHFNIIHVLVLYWLASQNSWICRASEHQFRLCGICHHLCYRQFTPDRVLQVPRLTI